MIGNPWDFLIHKFEDTPDKVYKFKFTADEMYAIAETVFIEHTVFGEELSTLGEKRCQSILGATGDSSNYKYKDETYDMEMTGGEASLLVTAFKDFLYRTNFDNDTGDSCMSVTYKLVDGVYE